VKGLAQAQNISTGQVQEQFFRNVRPTSLFQRFTRADERRRHGLFLLSPSATNGAQCPPRQAGCARFCEHPPIQHRQLLQQPDIQLFLTKEKRT
jgi:hypothetical protein